MGLAELHAVALRVLIDNDEFKKALDEIAISIEEVKAYLDIVKKLRLTFERKMQYISKKQLKMINSKIVRKRTLTRARESHRKVNEEVVDEE